MEFPIQWNCPLGLELSSALMCRDSKFMTINGVQAAIFYPPRKIGNIGCKLGLFDWFVDECERETGVNT